MWGHVGNLGGSWPDVGDVNKASARGAPGGNICPRGDEEGREGRPEPGLGR